MSQRSRSEDAHTVTCLYCLQDWIDKDKKLQQKYISGPCRQCRNMKSNLLHGEAGNLSAVVVRCLHLGYKHAGRFKNPRLTGPQLTEAMLTNWRLGHVPMLYAAYKMGFYHRKWKDADKHKE